MSWSMIETCMRKQGGTVNGVVPVEYQVVDAMYHPTHAEHIEAGDELWAPNLVLWTGFDHRYVLQLKDDE